MNKINILKPYIANQIAAGEVVDRPSSVVKELIENSIDADATKITLEIKNGGVDYIRVNDNGVGIHAEYTLIAFERHATSKISDREDLEHIDTLGFRGEALSSIAAVAQVELITRAKGEEIGTQIRIEGGECKLHKQVGTVEGTTVVVENLFFNVPARRKFLKSMRTEAAHIGDYVQRVILSHPEIAFRYINNGTEVNKSNGDNDLKNAVYSIYGSQTIEHLKEIEYDDGYMRVFGFIGSQNISKTNRRDQSFFLNGRYIQSYGISSALQRAYGDRLMGGRYPLAVLHILISSREVDVNVHPSKLEVKFSNEQQVFRAIENTCRKALGNAEIPTFKMDDNFSRAKVPLGHSQSDIIKPAVSLDDHRAGKVPKDAIFADGSDDELDLSFPLITNKAKTSGIMVKENFYEIPHFKVESPAFNSQSENIGNKLNEENSNSADKDAKEIIIKENIIEDVKPFHETQQSFGEMPYSIIGQAFQSYWLVQQGDDLFFIDQHAAHERKLYEYFTANFNNIASQQLLSAELVQFTSIEFALYNEYRELLTSLGFEFDDFGVNTIRVFALPIVLANIPVERVLKDALALLEKQGSVSTMELQLEAIIQSSCKHAIKAGDAIDMNEIKHLLDYFITDGTPLTCPHGRPIMFRLARKDVEKMFKRIK